MTRFGGFFWVAVLLIAAWLLRWSAFGDAAALQQGEVRGKATLLELYHWSNQYVRAGTPHPGLEALLENVEGNDTGLEMISELGTDRHAFARDDAYVYGLATTAQPNPRRRFGFLLRAWPLEFGVTGDREFALADDGALFEGLNQRGRGGAIKDSLPSMPDPRITEPGAPWILIWQDPDQR